MGYLGIVPYTSIAIDCCWHDFIKSAKLCLEEESREVRLEVIGKLQSTWTHPDDCRPVLPCSSVRSALDLFLSVKNYPRGSEIIMSAINIPDMATVVHHHGLRIVTADVAMETMCPKLEWLEELISSKTVALLLAHVYGTWFDISPFVAAARRHQIDVIEDCAEGFSGLQRTGHPEADISLFSFGIIKFATAFGGAIAKVKNQQLHQSMSKLYLSYPLQSHANFLNKLMKYSVIFMLLHNITVNNIGQWLLKKLQIDPKGYIVNSIRSFPKDLVKKIREQPSLALLKTMQRRFNEYDPEEIGVANAKAEYVKKCLPSSVTKVGEKAFIKNHWLFPVIVDEPEEVVKSLNVLGVDAYRGATQLTLIEPDNGNSHLAHLKSFITRYPHEAQFLIDHVIYLPVHKDVPYDELDKICEAMCAVMQPFTGKTDVNSHVTAWKTKMKSKL